MRFCVALRFPLSVQAQSSLHSHRGSKHSSSSSSNGKGTPVKRLVHISSLKALFRSSSSSRHGNSHSRSSSRFVVAAAAADMRPSAAATSQSTHLAVQSRSLSGSRSDLLRSSSNAKGFSSSSIGSSSYSSSCKALPAAVSLFSTQPLADAPRGPSVTRFCASKGGGCSVVTHCVP